MSAISTGDFAKSVAPQLPDWFGLGYERNPALYERVFTVKSMDQATDEDVLVSGTGLMIQTSESENTPYDHAKQGYVQRSRAVDYRLGLIVTKNMIRDGKGFQIAEERAKMLGVSYMETKNIVAFNYLNNGFSVANGGDGKALLATDHPTVAGNQSNRLATDADFSEASFEQLFLEMGDIKDDRGLRVVVRPKTLVIPRALHFDARRFINNPDRPGTTDRDINVTNRDGMLPGGIVDVDYLTDADAWFVLTSQDMQGLMFKVRQELELSNDTAFDSDNVKFKAHARFVPTHVDWRCIAGSPGA
jgi:hypothetical protein